MGRMMIIAISQQEHDQQKQLTRDNQLQEDKKYNYSFIHHLNVYYDDEGEKSGGEREMVR